MYEFQDFETSHTGEGDVKTKPIADLKSGDVIVGPFGRYELRVTEINSEYVRGIYTKCPAQGYEVGSPCCYPLSDWKALGDIMQHVEE